VNFEEIEVAARYIAAGFSPDPDAPTSEGRCRTGSKLDAGPTSNDLATILIRARDGPAADDCKTFVVLRSFGASWRSGCVEHIVN